MKSIFIAIVVLFVSISGQCQCERKAKVKYKRADETWSKNYEVDVTFIGGADLNEATKSSDYYIYGIYAVIFWSEEQVSIIDIWNKNLLSCTAYTLDCDCINKMSFNFHGKDQTDKYWEICTKNYCY